MRNRIGYVLILLLTGCYGNELLRRTPVKWDVDLVKVEQEHFTEFKTHLLPEGLTIYFKRDPGDLTQLYQQGMRQADGAYHNGMALAAVTFKYAVTKDPEMLKLAQRIWDGHHKLVTMSGYPGLVARSYGKETPDAPDYVVRKDGSGDGLVGWMFGTSVFVNLIDDPVRKAQAAADVKAITQHLKKHDFKIYENATTPTQYGDFKTPIFGVPVGHYAIAMMALANLAIKLNPNDVDCISFLDLLIKKDYHRQTTYFYSWFPHEADNTAMYLLNAFSVWMNDKTPRRRMYYREGIDSAWKRCFSWQMAFYALIYKYTEGDEHSSHITNSIARLRNLYQRYAPYINERNEVKSYSKIVPIEDRVLTSSIWTRKPNEESKIKSGPQEKDQWCRVDFLLAYWMGRWMGEYSPQKTSSK